MPTIVSSTGRNNTESIKRYFCSEYSCMMIAGDAGVSYEAMLAGKYKLLVEPFAYFTHNGLYYCMTATKGGLEVPDVECRVNTDVITSITLRTSENLTPDNPASVTFHILDTSYQVNNIVIPKDDSQVVWGKWHTPGTPPARRRTSASRCQYPVPPRRRLPSPPGS